MKSARSHHQAFPLKWTQNCNKVQSFGGVQKLQLHDNIIPVVAVTVLVFIQDTGNELVFTNAPDIQNL